MIEMSGGWVHSILRARASLLISALVKIEEIYEQAIYLAHPNNDRHKSRIARR